MNLVKKDMWAYIAPSGNVLADSLFKTEDEAWRVALGWPTAGEVKEAKRSGARVVRVTVTEVA